MVPWLGALALAIASVAIVTTGVSASSSPPGASPPGATEQIGVEPTLVYQCFTLNRGDDPIAPVYLATLNFGTDSVVVRQSNIMCETANKFANPGSDDPLFPPELATAEALQCWNLAKGQDPYDDVLLITENFGTDKATVRRSRMMCENAVKQRLDSTKPPIGVGGIDRVWQCFALTDTTPAPSLPAVLVTRNFGREKGEIGRAVMMCETAQKVRLFATGAQTFGQATGQVIECRTFTTPKDNQAPVRLNTNNFGDDTAVVRTSRFVCEHAQKIRLPQLPD